MTARTPPAPAALDPSGIRSAVEALLLGFLDEQERIATTPEVALFTGLLRDMLASGGKRIRPVLCVTGWHTVSSEPPPPVVYRMAASLELFHAFALIHDDIMDRSDIRRGRPTAHRALAARHADHPAGPEFGVNAAILLGDLTLGWSYDLLHAPGIVQEQLTAVWPMLNALRTETLVGQYLDLRATGRPAADADTAWRIIRYKTAKYTVERPLQLSALLAGAGPAQLAALTAYAGPLGEAFQLRDDLLGVFGDPERTGKGSCDDLSEGKHTVLVATALQRATAAQRHVLRRHLGRPGLDPATAEEIRSILISTGARAAVEQYIGERCEQALAALAASPFPEPARAVLHTLALTATRRAT
jgi:geranylgeranyl diphosphate synthase type I